MSARAKHRSKHRRSHSRRGRKVTVRRARGHRKLSAGKRRRLSRSWRKKTAPGRKYAMFGAVVQKRPGKRVHRRGYRFSGRKGTVKLFSRRSGKLAMTNPRRRSHHRSGRSFGFMRNPMKAASGFIHDTWVQPIVTLPKTLPALFKTKPLKHAVFATGGAVAGLVGGSAVQSFVLTNLAAYLPTSVAGALGTGLIQRVVGAGFSLLAGGLVARFAIKDRDAATAFIVGTAAASLAEAVFPAQVGSFFASLPVVGGWFSGFNASPVSGLAGLFGSDELAAYVQSPAYQGVGAYVQSPAYQGVGAYVQSPAYQGVGAYVQSPAYQGVGGLGALAGRRSDAVAGMGVIGSNMPSHLDT